MDGLASGDNLMCELLIHVIDKVNADSVYLNAKLPKTGHVVVVCDDGWAWGDMELTLPDFRLFKAPGFDATFFEPLLSNEIATVPGQTFGDVTNTLQYRGYKMDILNTAVPADIAAYLADATRLAPFMTLDSVTAAALQAFIAQCPPIPDPSVIG